MLEVPISRMVDYRTYTHSADRGLNITLPRDRDRDLSMEPDLEHDQREDNALE